MNSKSKSSDPEFIDYNDALIIYIPVDDNYIVNDIEFKNLDDAKTYIDNGMKMPSWMKDAYSKGIFQFAGDLPSSSWLSWLFW